MGKLVVATFLTLDGVMQGPGGPGEDPSGGFEHGGWSVAFWDDMMGRAITEIFAQADALLLGRKTYEIFAAHWPRVTDPEDLVATKLNTLPKHVASTTMKEAGWHNTTILEGDAADAVANLKGRTEGEILVQGSSRFLQTLLAHDLVDVFHVWVFPVVVGSGKRLFDDGTLPRNLRLTNSKTSTTGVLLLTYETAGEIAYGSFALEGQV